METRETAQRGEAATNGAPTFLSASVLAHASGRQECRRSVPAKNRRRPRRFGQILIEWKSALRSGAETLNRYGSAAVLSLNLNPAVEMAAKERKEHKKRGRHELNLKTAFQTAKDAKDAKGEGVEQESVFIQLVNRAFSPTHSVLAYFAYFAVPTSFSGLNCSV
ncbi:MAG: hypothetical protein AAB676_18905 [Verrucomicrobiota bacterium]